MWFDIWFKGRRIVLGNSSHTFTTSSTKIYPKPLLSFKLKLDYSVKLLVCLYISLSLKLMQKFVHKLCKVLSWWSKSMKLSSHLPLCPGKLGWGTFYSFCISLLFDVRLFLENHLIASHHFLRDGPLITRGLTH